MSTTPTHTTTQIYRTSTLQPTAVLNTGIFGTVVGSTAAMGINLHKVRDKEMTLGEATADSLAKGAGAGIAAAVATAAVQSLGGSRLTNWTVLLATATGVGYAINTLGRKKTTDND